MILTSIDPIDITIVNPYSPALMIIAIIAGSFIVLGVILGIIAGIVSDEASVGGGVFFLGIFIGFFTFLIGYGSISTADSDAREGRIVDKLTDLGYSHVDIHMSSGDLTAKGPDGEFVTAVIHMDSYQHYTIFPR